VAEFGFYKHPKMASGGVAGFPPFPSCIQAPVYGGRRGFLFYFWGQYTNPYKSLTNPGFMKRHEAA
jgi:hypothetical protein